MTFFKGFECGGSWYDSAYSICFTEDEEHCGQVRQILHVEIAR